MEPARRPCATMPGEPAQRPLGARLDPGGRRVARRARERPVEVGDHQQRGRRLDEPVERGGDLGRRRDRVGHGWTSTPGRIVATPRAMTSGPMPPAAPSRTMPSASIGCGPGAPGDPRPTRRRRAGDRHGDVAEALALGAVGGVDGVGVALGAVGGVDGVGAADGARARGGRGRDGTGVAIGGAVGGGPRNRIPPRTSPATATPASRPTTIDRRGHMSARVPVRAARGASEGPLLRCRVRWTASARDCSRPCSPRSASRSSPPGC